MKNGFRISFGTLFAISLVAISSTTAFAARTPATDSSFSTSRQPLFGSNETQHADLSRFKYWTDAMARTQAELSAAKTVCAHGQTQNCAPPEWASLVEELKGLPLREKIIRANAAMNSHPYVPTERNWHRAMYWETPFQFLRFGGQCQDYAIAKYVLLRQSGVPADAMRMVVLRDTEIAQDHAILAVYVNGEAMLLDNLNARVVPADSVSFYRPYYSINEQSWWQHTGGHAMYASLATARR